jgi:hypothetical protein
MPARTLNMYMPCPSNQTPSSGVAQGLGTYLAQPLFTCHGLSPTRGYGGLISLRVPQARL